MSSRPFKPKWSLLKATQESLRQSWAERKRLGEELAFERREVAHLRRTLRKIAAGGMQHEVVDALAADALDAEKKRRAKRRRK